MAALANLLIVSDLHFGEELLPGASMERRHAALGCLERHLRDARRAVASTADPAVRAEYEVTCERLRDVRRMI